MLRALQNQRRRSADAGFTLIELLIVIIILGVLAAIVVFSVRGITDKGATAACKTSVSTIDTAFEAYAAGLASPSSADTTTKTIASLAPTFLHVAPAVGTVIGNLTVAAGTTVSDVDGATC
jgi:general secretion pathway protein G